MGTGSRHAKASSHSPADDRNLWQHHADRTPESSDIRFTSLESMNIGGCALLETRDGLVPVRTNLIGLVDRKQSTRD
jgi:hypothetical protein